MHLPHVTSSTWRCWKGIQQDSAMIEFKGNHFERKLIMGGFRCYVAYPISYRQLEVMMEERGVAVTFHGGPVRSVVGSARSHPQAPRWVHWTIHRTPHQRMWRSILWRIGQTDYCSMGCIEFCEGS